MNSESKWQTNFVTHWGRVCNKRMPFGITSAPEFFQKETKKILQGLGVVCIMNNVLVFASTPPEHWSRIRNLRKN